MAPIVIQGFLLTVVTLGVYRFWYLTNLRRFLWGATEIDGDRLEYTGRGVELLLGFLIALAVVVPLSAGAQLVGLMFGPLAAAVISPLTTVGLIVLAQYGLYRARRYRLTRTIWRGVRLQQTGSGWAYVGRSLGWGLVTVLTLGLAYPVMRASLERYKLDNTWYGDQRGVFLGTAGTLFRRGLPLWLIGWLFVGGTVAYAVWVQKGEALAGSSLEAAKAFLGVEAVATIIVVGVLFALFQAIEFRWWAQAVRIGPATMTSDLSLAAFLEVYLLVGLMLAACVVALGGVGYLAVMPRDAVGAGPGAAVSLFLLYLGGGVIVATLWRLFGVRLIWKRSFESLTIVDLPALHATQSALPPANAFGEGVADALDFSGF